MLQNDNYFQLYDLNHFCLGCKDPADCKIKDGCPNREEGSVCYKYGCCNTSFCVAEYTLGSFFDKPSPSPSPSPGTLTPPPGTPTPSINVQVSTVQTPPIKKSPSPVLPDSPTPSPSAMSTKLVVMATSSMPAEMTKVTSKPEMQSSDMSMEKPMTSSKAEVMPTETKATMMSSSVDMPSKPSVGTVQSLVNVDIDDRPTCPNHSGRVFSLSAVVLIAIVVLCNLF